MTEDQTLVYVKAAATAMRMPLDDLRAERVAAHLQRTAGFAATLEAVQLEPHDEPAELFCPAPFNKTR